MCQRNEAPYNPEVKTQAGQAISSFLFIFHCLFLTYQHICKTQQALLVKEKQGGQQGSI